MENQETVVRTKDVIDGEYKNLCAVFGDNQYRYELMKAELVQKMFALNKEYSALEIVPEVKPDETA
jgi:predicted KAP-like P-loop ATPase